LCFLEVGTKISSTSGGRSVDIVRLRTKGHGVFCFCELRPSVTGCDSTLGCEMSRILHFLHRRLIDGGEVSLTLRPSLTSQDVSWHSFLLAESIQGTSCGLKVKSTEKSIH
jgi:hypothetical protein